MDIKRSDLSQLLNAGTRQNVPKTLGTDARFRDILMMWQDDGVVAKDAEAPAETLTGAQKLRLRDEYDVNDMASLANKRALLNELVTLGVLTAEESELSGMQMLPPAGPGGLMMSGGAPGFEAMMEEGNYLTHLEKAMEFDNLWSRSEDVKGAREKLYTVLKDIYG